MTGNLTQRGKVMDYFGKWTAFQIQGKIAVMQIISEKGKTTGFKIFDSNSITKATGVIAKVESLFKKHEGKEVKVIAIESYADEYNGKLKASELVFINLVVDEVADPEPVKEEPAIERESYDSDSSDVPF